MMATSIRFLNIVLVALVSGTVFGIWVGYNPGNFSANAYLEQQQGAIRGLNTLMPVLGLITTILTIVSAFLQKEDRNSFILLLVAATLLIASGLVTRFGNQPINAIVMTWTADSLPGNWTELRDRWWSLHMVRTLASLLSLLLIAWSSVKKS